MASSASAQTGPAPGVAQPTTAASAPIAARAPASPRTIVQQRLPDGRVIFTDRPQPGAKTERSWLTTPEDPAAGEARRAASQRESTVVSERLGRQIEQQRQRDQELALARERSAQARAERDTARERAQLEQAPPQIVLLPQRAPHQPPYRPPGWRPGVQPPPPQAQPPRPGPEPPPRPGATPPPRPNGAPAEPALQPYPN